MRLLSVNDDNDDTRRRVRRSELEGLGVDQRTLESVLDAFGSFRLLSFDHDPVTPGPHRRGCPRGVDPGVAPLPQLDRRADATTCGSHADSSPSDQ